MNNARHARLRPTSPTRKHGGRILCGVLCLTVWCARDASSQTAAQWVTMGRAALISNNIVAANTDFSNAVAVSSSNPDANFFYAFTRVAVLPFQPAVKGLLDGFGVSSTGRDLWHWTADFQRNLFNQIVLPTNSPTEAVVLGVLTNTVLPQITGALTNLTHVPHNYTNVIGAELNFSAPHEVTYNIDVVLYQSALQTAQAGILTLNSYNLDANISALVSNLEAGTFNLNTFLAASPQFLTPTSAAASLLPSAATALNAAIDAFEDGSEAVYGDRGKPLGSPGLIEHLLEIQDALYGPEPFSLKKGSGTMLLDLTPFFYSGPVNFRSLLPQLRIDPLSLRPRIVADSFPDPTFDGILPEATQQWWIDSLRAPFIMLPADPNWQTDVFGSGLDDWVDAMALAGTNVYVGGGFSTAGAVAANNIAVWNGTSWSALGAGLSGPVSALAISGTNLYAGGYFTTAGAVAANNIATWNGASWSTLGTGLGGLVHALAVSGTNLYAGGSFTNIGAVRANGIAVWNGTSWSPLGNGVTGQSRGVVYALAVSGSNLYVGGSFTNAGTVQANSIAMWNGSSWSALGNGVTSPYGSIVYALTLSGTSLYAGGFFTNAGAVAANNIAVWNGSSWSALGGGVGDVDAYVDALALSGTNLYAGGYFTNAGPVAANNIAMWNGTSWSALGSGIDGGNGWVGAIVPNGTNTYVGGTFGYAGGWKAHNIAIWHTPVVPVPSANFIANPASGIAPLSVNFTDLSIGIVTNWYWNFGDGTTTNVTTSSVVHTYSVGTYTVTVVVTGPGGVSASTQPNAIMAMTAFQSWQMQYFGCADCPQAQPDADPLGKGMSNTNQFLAGLNPTNANSMLRFISVAAQGSNMVVTWKTAGVRINVVQATKGSGVGGYSNSFQDISGPITINIPGDTSTNYTDAGGATNRPSRYYRIRLGP